MTTAATPRASLLPPVEAESAEASPRLRRRGLWLTITTHAIILAVLGGSIWAGLHLRRWAWDQTETIRFTGDIRNGFNWGRRALDVGFLDLYDKVVADSGDTTRYRLDYTPLRLGVMTAWTAWLGREFPDITRWENSYAHTWPLLYFNIACQLASLPAMFLLVRLWAGRSTATHPSSLKPSILAAAATLLLWFNPAVIWEAHCWPQWDIWCVPFFLWAVYLASVDRWLTAGALIALGAMLKGQVLLVAPVLVLWPMCQGRFGAAARLLVGAALGAALAVSPWLVRSSTAAISLALLAVSGAALISLIAQRQRWSRSTRVTLCLTWLTAALWLTAAAHDASFAWYHVGFRGPQENHRSLIMGPVSNLAGILAVNHRWKLYDPVALPWTDWTPALRTVLIVAYAVPLVLCGMAAARLDRRRDPRFLLAVIGPWVFMFALMPQMHERYLLWAAAATAAWAALGIAPLLLHLFITAVAWAMMAHVMLNFDRDWSPAWLEFLRGTHPGVAWGLLVAAAALLVMMHPRTYSGRHAGKQNIHNQRADAPV
jgi:hypothetical protein